MCRPLDGTLVYVHETTGRRKFFLKFGCLNLLTGDLKMSRDS